MVFKKKDSKKIDPEKEKSKSSTAKKPMMKPKKKK